MAGTWMSIVEGFGGMRVVNNKLSFSPKIPEQWQGYSFKINFRGQILKINVQQTGTKFFLEGDKELDVLINGKEIKIAPEAELTI
jgi:maltose phosphorylase